MTIRKIITALVLVLGSVWAPQAFAEGSDITPLKIGIFPPLQLPHSQYGVTGLRLAVVGKSRTVRGIDLALLGNMTEVDNKGIAIAGLFNYNRGSSAVIGLQFAGLANVNAGHSSVYGVQVAAHNKAGTVYGLQLGLINVAETLHGIQIGLFNVNKNGPFHASPIINAAF